MNQINNCFCLLYPHICVGTPHLYGDQPASSHELSPMRTTYFSKNSRSKMHKYHHNAYAAMCPPQHHYTQRHTYILASYSFYHACPSPPTVHTSCYHCLPTLTIIHIITTHHFNMQIHTALPSVHYNPSSGIYSL